MSKKKRGKVGALVKETSGTANPALWFVNAMGGGGQTTAGMGVGPGSAMRCAAVYACVRVVSEDVAKLPLVLYRRRGDKKAKVPADTHPLHRILKARPNAWQSSFEWREMMQAHLELRGNAYSFIVRDGRGQVQELLPLHPDRVTLMLAEDGEVFYQLSRGANEPAVPMIAPRSAILHLRGMTFDGYHGVSTVTWLRETIGLSLASEQHGAAYFGNGARPDVVITSKSVLTKEQAEDVRNRWEQLYRGPKGAYRPAVLPHDLAVEKLGITNKDSQFLELRQFQVSDVARGFRIPPHKIGDLTRSTFNNIEHQGLEYYLDGLMPRLERFEAAMMRDLLTEEEQRDYEIEFDFTRILRGDLKTTMEAIASGRNWGIVSANEARTWLNLPPREGGDTYLEPLNTVPAGQQPVHEPAQPAIHDDAAPPVPDDDEQRAMRLLQRLN